MSVLQKLLKSNSKGQSLSEYVIILTLVAVAIIVSMSMLGQSTSLSISSITDKLNSSNVKQNIASSQQPGNGILAITAQPGGNTQNTGIKGENIATVISPVDFDGSPNSIISSFDSTGSQGATQLLLASLESKIPALLANKQITQADADRLKQLANLGHQMAAIEKSVEDAMVNSKNNLIKLNTQPITYNNKKYTLSSVLGQIQLVDTLGSDARIPINPSSVVGQFYELRNSTLKNIQDPTVKEYVATLSHDIMAIGDSVENTANEVRLGLAGAPSNFQTSLINQVRNDNQLKAVPVDTLDSSSASAVTSQTSSNICTIQGGSVDTGAQCK